MAIEKQQFYTTAEITPGLMLNVISETPPRAEAILNYLDRVANDTDKIRVRVRIYNNVETFPIVGFNDRTPLGQGIEADEFDANPYHFKKGWKADVNSAYLVRVADGFGLSGEGVVVGTVWLEEQRRNTLAALWLTALNEKAFVWKDVAAGSDAPAERVLEMDYGDAIVDLTAPATPLDNPASKLFSSIDKMTEEYYENCGFFPDIAFVSGPTFNILKDHPQAEKQVRAQATDEPDKSFTTRDECVIGTIKFVAMRGKYTKPDGSQSGPVALGRAIVTTEGKLLEDGGQVLRHECAANILNNFNAASAYYEAHQHSVKPPLVVLDAYDNGVPVIAHRKAVGHWQMWT